MNYKVIRERATGRIVGLGPDHGGFDHPVDPATQVMTIEDGAAAVEEYQRLWAPPDPKVVWRQAIEGATSIEELKAALKHVLHLE